MSISFIKYNKQSKDAQAETNRYNRYVFKTSYVYTCNILLITKKYDLEVSVTVFTRMCQHRICSYVIVDNL